MVDIKKQVEYWVRGTDDALETAGILLKKGKYNHGLFFCHLAIEKIVKAHVVKVTNQIAKKSHNLFRLLETAGILIDDEKTEFLGILMKYQLEGRYPDYNPVIPGKKKVKEYFQKTKEIVTWLKKKL
jgi:HEPN domain-containing protein